MRGEQASIDAEGAGLVGVASRYTDAAGVDEGIVERGALNEAREARARHLLEAVEGLMIADRDADGRIGRRIGQDDIAETDVAAGEIHFGLVADTARDGAFRSKADAARAGVEAEVAIDDAIVGIFDESDVILNAAARLERPAGFLVLELGRPSTTGWS